MAKKILEEYGAKKKSDGKPSVASLAPPEADKVSKKNPDNDTAVLQAEIGEFKFACRVDSGADRDAVSETIA